MIIAALSIVLGILVGLASGGTLAALRESSLRFEALIVVLFLGQALARGRLFAGVGASRFGIPVWVAVSSVLVVVLLMNAARSGVILVSVGMLLNMIAVMLNGAMPLSALPEGLDAAAEIGASGGFYAFADAGTLLPVIADAMPLILGRTTLMMSVGDVAIGVGVITIIVGAMLGESGQGKTSRNGFVRLSHRWPH